MTSEYYRIGGIIGIVVVQSADSVVESTNSTGDSSPDLARIDLCVWALKPSSHRRDCQRLQPKDTKRFENRLKIAIFKGFSKNFMQIPSRFHGIYLFFPVLSM